MEKEKTLPKRQSQARKIIIRFAGAKKDEKNLIPFEEIEKRYRHCKRINPESEIFIEINK